MAETTAPSRHLSNTPVNISDLGNPVMKSIVTVFQCTISNW